MQVSKRVTFTNISGLCSNTFATSMSITGTVNPILVEIVDQKNSATVLSSLTAISLNLFTRRLNCNPRSPALLNLLPASDPRPYFVEVLPSFLYFWYLLISWLVLSSFSLHEHGVCDYMKDVLCLFEKR